MKSQLRASRSSPPGVDGLTYVEVLVATAIILTILTAFYGAMVCGVRTIQVARENLRATQILVSEMEGIRLSTWNQLTNTALLPTNFTVSYFPGAASGSQGLIYIGAAAWFRPT